MDAITFRFLIGLVVSETLDIRLMNVVTTYSYESSDKDIHMKITEEFKMSETFYDKPRSVYYIKLQKSLYRLKHPHRMWYNYLYEYLIEKGFESNEIFPSIFIKKNTSGFAIVAIDIDNLNLVGTPEKLIRTITYGCSIT
jgi:hypothetical protein